MDNWGINDNRLIKSLIKQEEHQKETRLKLEHCFKELDKCDLAIKRMNDTLLQLEGLLNLNKQD